MSIFDWQALRRNWLVSVSGLVITVGLAGASEVLLPAGYSTTSQIVLLPPVDQQSVGSSGAENPYLGLSGLQSMASVVSSSMMDDDTAKTLQRVGVSKYSVQYDALSGGPVLISQVTEPTPGKAESAIAALDKQVPIAIARLQDEVSISSASFVTAHVIATPTAPARSVKQQLRVMGMVLVVGVILTLLTISVIESSRTRRTLHQVHEESEKRISCGDETLPDIRSYRSSAREPEFIPANRSNNVSSERHR